MCLMRYETDSLAGDRFFRNDELKESDFSMMLPVKLVYTSQIGYGLGVNISDINNDCFPDIYISNDFHENDYFYINNGDGTFTEKLTGSM